MRNRDWGRGQTGLAALLVLASAVSAAANGTAADKPVHVVGDAVAWEAVEHHALPPGLQAKRLHRYAHNQGGATRLRFPAGYTEPRHYHATAGHSIYVLAGRIRFDGAEAGPGDFFHTPALHPHELFAIEAAEILIWSDGPLDFHLGEPGDR